MSNIESRLNELEKPDRLLGPLRACAKLKRERTEVVYVVQAGEFFKIGVATDVQVRIREMQTGCPLEITLVASVPCRNPYVSESIVHRHLAEYRVRGEWFKTDLGMIDEAMMLVGLSRMRSESFDPIIRGSVTV
jgi:hypothetical protein